jgi:predicted negative regulator of RcsB-dependent stress response
MATHLYLQEQEQIDDIKAFWKQYGDLITWTLVIVLAAFAAWNGWNTWQRSQGAKAGALFDQLEQAVQAGDAERVGRAFADLRERYPRTAYAQQGALLAAKLQYDKGQADAARATLEWAAEHAGDDAYKTAARLRLAGLLMDAKEYDKALALLDAPPEKSFEALVADRRGDVLMAQGKHNEARSAYLAAWKAMEPTLDYRRVIDAKLAALAVAPEAAASSAAASGAAP